MKKYTIITLIILLTPILLTSQSIFLEKGTSAGSLEVGIGNVEEEAFYNIHGSYSLKGIIDFTLTYEKSDFDEDAKLNKLRFGTDYLILKQGSQMPVNWNIGGSYSFGSISDEEYAALGVDLSINELRLSTGVSRVIKTFILIAPYASIDYNRLTATATYGEDSESESDSGINYTVGAHLGIYAGRNLITLNPYFSFGYFSSAGLRLSFVINSK
ncbi:MAG: hypothetical protein KJO29_10815 [Bacteroidia bacterium]|nr:hypothetical protein [Bacteroidia bacterium]